MVTCTNCSTPNSLDSAFCKRCGGTLASEDVQAAAARLETLIAEGESALNAGDTESAMAVAETAVASDPSSIRALALKSLCHERRGEIAPALEAAEEIVELSPDSELDKIRRNHLRTLLMSQAQLRVEPDRRTAVVAASAAALLVVCAGALAATLMRQPPKDEVRVAQQEVQNPVSDPKTIGSLPPQNPGATGNSATNSGGGTTSANPTQDAPSRTPRGTGLPAPTEHMTIPPLRLVPEGLGGSIGANRLPAADGTKETSRPPVKPDDDPDPGADPGGRSTPVEEPKRDPGVYEITVHKPDRLPGGGTNASSTNGVEALVRTGTQQYQVGNYGGAANTLERALNSGADPVSVNQRLAQAYERSGRKSDAIGAYSRAIAAAEGAIASGRGNRGRLEAAIESCKAALKVLQGS